MPSSPKKSKSTATIGSQPQAVRLWLMYPPKLIKTPMIWQLGHKFKLTTNVRQASVLVATGELHLELDGQRAGIKAAIRWLVKQRLSLQPVENNDIEG